MDLITLTTDFGTVDGYPSVMKGVILKINPKIRILDITHSVQSQNILHGAFIIYSVIDYFPKAVHIGVIDPGVGTSRAGLIFECNNSILIGPDNGLLSPAAEKLGIINVYKITNFNYCLSKISSTFHGRDIFAPVAAYITTGVELKNIGENTEEYAKLDLLKISESHDGITGKVLNIDHFGNIITNIPKEIIEKYFQVGDDLFISVEQNRMPIDNKFGDIKRGIRIIPFKTTYSDVTKGDLVAIISSSGFLEISGNSCSANNYLKTTISDRIRIQK